jgi:excisionase family DNA binding protein
LHDVPVDDKTYRTMPSTLTIPMARDRHPAVGRNRIYAAIAAGALPAVRVGRRIAIRVEDLDAWVMAGCPVQS